MVLSALGPLLLALPALVLSDYQLAEGDVPRPCNSICEPVVNLTSTCDAGGNSSVSSRDKELLEKQCICLNDSFDVANRTALCASCIGQQANGTAGGGNSTVGGGGGGNSTVGGNSTSGNSTEGELSSARPVLTWSSLWTLGTLRSPHHPRRRKKKCKRNGGHKTNTGKPDINSIMSACGFPSHTWATNMTTATSANVTATPPTGTGALTTTISTGVPVPTDGQGAAMRAGVSAAGGLCALVAVAVAAL